VTRRLWIGAAIVIISNALMITFVTFDTFGRFLLVASVIFGAVAFACRRDARRLPLIMIVIITAAVQLPGLFSYPLTSDDAYRYVWDGRVQLAGIDPYRYVPLDPALAGFRDPQLFPPDEPPLINRPGVPTLYPPVAQLWFASWALVTPLAWDSLGVQIGAALAVVATTVVLARFLGDRRGWALVYGACPAVAVEAGNGAHIDALAALCVVGLGWAAVRRRHWLAGLFLGLAAGIKLVPLLLVPVFLRHGRWRTSVTSIALLIAGYLPHLLAVGTLVFGFLPGYWQEEGYDGGRRFALLIMLPEPVRTPVALIVALALAVLALSRSGREPVLVTCCWLYGAAFLVATPIYPWYALAYVVIVIMAGRLEWLALWPAMYVAFIYDHEPVVQAAAYGLALMVIAVFTVLRRTPTSRCRSATAGRRARARESPPGVGHAAIGTRVALRHRSGLSARLHVRP
jgi:hypothetical protein